MERFIPESVKLETTIKKKPKEDPVGLFLELFGKEQNVDSSVAEKIDFSYLTPEQKAESMWAIFQDAKGLMSHLAASGIGEGEGGAKLQNLESRKSILQKLRQNLGILKSFYEDSDTQKTYIEQHKRHLREIEGINGDSEKYKILVREIKEKQKIVDACARRIFSERGGKSSELDNLVFVAGKNKLREKQAELENLIESNPELGGLDQYQKIKEGSAQLRTERFIWAPSRRKLLEETEEAALSGKPVLLSGESGTGKTRLVEQASLKLTGQINNQTPGKDVRFQDLIAKPKISQTGETYYEYKEIGEAATGKASTLEKKPEHHGRIVADDEFNLLREAEQTERLARIASWTPGKKVRMPVTNKEETIASNFMYCAMVNLASERYTRKKIPLDVLRKFAKVDVGYLEQSVENPEIYETMISALLDKYGRLRVAKGEIAPMYEFREETRAVKKDGQDIKQTVNIRELKTAEEKNGKTVIAGGFLWRLANVLDEMNKSFSRKETVLKAKGEAQFLRELIIDIGTVLGWLEEYGTSGRGKSLEIFFADKIQKEFLSREAYSLEDRQLVKEFLKHFGIDLETSKKNKKEDIKFEILTPLEIGLLSPRVRYEKVVSEEPVLAESFYVSDEGKRVEYRIAKFEQDGREFVPGGIYAILKPDGTKRALKFLGVNKETGLPVLFPYKKERKTAPRQETQTKPIIQTSWLNPETGQEQPIEINLEEKLTGFKAFYKDRLGLDIDESKVRKIWQANYTEIKEEIEKYGYDDILIIPENLPKEEVLNQQLIETMEETVKGKKTKVAATFQGSNFTTGGSFAGVKNSYSPEYRIVFTHSIQNLEDHPILNAIRNKKVMDITGLSEAEINRRITAGEELPVNCEIEINGQKIEIKAEGESLEEYLIQQRMYFDKTGQHLDTKNNSYAILLKSCSGSRVVDACWFPDARQLRVYAGAHGFADARLGSRLSRSFKKLA